MSTHAPPHPAQLFGPTPTRFPHQRRSTAILLSPLTPPRRRADTTTTGPLRPGRRAAANDTLRYAAPTPAARGGGGGDGAEQGWSRNTEIGARKEPLFRDDLVRVASPVGGQSIALAGQGEDARAPEPLAGFLQLHTAARDTEAEADPEPAADSIRRRLDTCYTLDMYDASSDGWEGAIWTWTSTTTNTAVTGTLAGGGFGTDALCGTGCYSFTVGDGPYPAEISWTITDDNGDEVAAGAQGSATSTTTEVCVSPTCNDYAGGYVGRTSATRRAATRRHAPPRGHHAATTQ